MFLQAGLRIFGLQAEIDKVCQSKELALPLMSDSWEGSIDCHALIKVDCDKTDLLDNVLNSTSVERTVISTYGSFIANSLADWSRQVVDLVQGKMNCEDNFRQLNSCTIPSSRQKVARLIRE